MTLSNFPMVAWANDSFQVWQARELSSRALSATAGVVGSVVSGVIGGAASPAIAASLASNTFGFITSSLQSGYIAEKDRVINKGTLNSGNSVVGTFHDLYAVRLSITSQYAQVIDNYFTMFGYAIKSIGVPSRYNRTRFTYIKTIGCIVKGNLPNDAKQIIQNRYNEGIRFWVDRLNIGDYSSDNNVLS